MARAGLTSPPPKARYTRDDRKAFQSGAVADPRRGQGNFSHAQRVAFNNGSQPDPRAPKMSQPVQAQPQQQMPQRPPMPQQQFPTSPNFAPGQMPQMPNMQGGFSGWGGMQYPQMGQMIGNQMNGSYGQPAQGFNPKFYGGQSNSFQMGAGFPGGAQLPQNQGYKAPMWKR